MTIPIRLTPGKPEAADEVSPLHRLEHALQKPVAFLVVPLFGFANAGVSFAGITPAVFAEPLTLGVASGLVAGKLIGVFGAVWLMVRSGFADLPPGASWSQMTRRGPPVRHRIHDEPVHRPAGVRRPSDTGQDQARHPVRIADSGPERICCPEILERAEDIPSGEVVRGQKADAASARFALSCAKQTPYAVFHQSRREALTCRR